MSDEPLHGHLEDDLWSWIDQDDTADDAPDIDPSAVTAVMVVHDAAEFLPRQLVALAGLNPRPGRLVAVDTGSQDSSGDLLRKALAEGILDDVLTADRDVTFGQAVGLGLGEDEPEWVWLLHDDSSPRRGTLTRLLEGAKQADVVVPKLLQPKRRNYRETLSEVGQAITRGGERVPLVEEGDIDQGQTDARDVLGASTAGLLVRGETWRELGGIAPEVARHRDGVDFCWRANAVGFRVLTWPAGSLHHLRAGHTGLRHESRHPHLDDRLAALRIAGSRGASTFGLGAASLLRSAGFLLAKAPGFARAELGAFRRYRETAEETASLAARLPEEDLTPEELLPSRFWPVQHAFDRFGSAVSERYKDLTDTTEADTSLDELTSDDELTASVGRGFHVSPVAVLVVVLLVAAGVAARSLLGGGPISGGGLLAAPASLAAAWQAYLTGTAPWLGFAAFSSLGGFGSPGWFTFLAVILVPLLSGISALALLRHLRVALPVAAAAGGAWAGATILLGLVTAGDVSGMVLAVAAPILARAVHAVVIDEDTGAEGLRAPASAAFWLIVVSVVWPVALPLLTVVAVVWAVRDRERIVSVAIMVVPAWLVFIPWLPTLVRHPGRLLTGVDPLAWPDFPPASYALVVGRILPSGLPLWANIVFFAALGLVALLAISTLSRPAWTRAVVGVAAPLLVGTLLSRLIVEVDGGVARPLLSPWALLVVAALLAPAIWCDREETRIRSRGVLSMSLAGLLAVGVWAVVGFAGPVQSTTSVLPGYVRDVISSNRDSRALLVDLSDASAVSWSVVDARQPRWGSAERNPTGSFADQFAALAEAIAGANPPSDLADRFRELGVSHLWVRGFDQDHRAALDNLESLVSAAADDSSAVWTVGGLVSRVTIDSEPITDGQVPPGDEGRELRVADSPDVSWTASVDGQRLARGTTTTDVSREDVVTLTGVPADGGTLSIEPTPRWWQLALHVVVLLVVATLAAPTLGGATVARRGQS